VALDPVAFLCLGTMGYPIAGHLARAGHPVTVWNRTQERAQRFVTEHGGRAAASPAQAAAGARFVFTCSGNDDDLRAVVLGPEGAFAGIAAGAVFVDHTTVSAALARELAETARARGFESLDAPVSGGEKGAVTGALTVMVGGSEAAFAAAQPVISRYAKQALRIGPAGTGQLAKMVNQICIAGLLEGLAEGLRFAERAGLDVRRVIEAISQGAAQSWQMDNRAESMLERRFEFGFAVDWMRKDLRIALEAAATTGAELPVTELVLRLYDELHARGGGRLDTSSLITRLR
jgi:3-hydroxyisobutyrate dehydrogenase-like beta-hydroxyacid dehydrogenase